MHKSSGLYRKPKSTAKVASRPFWINPETGQRANEKREGYEYVASQLEWDCWQLLDSHNIYFKRQYDLALLGDESWRIDFFLPLQKIGVECKGRWLLDQDSEKQRCLKLQALIAESKGYRIIFCNHSPYTFRKISVISLKELIDNVTRD